MPNHTSTSDAALPQVRRPVGWLTIQLTAAAALVTLADALFYGHRLGISLALFLAALAAASASLNTVRAEPARRWRAVALLTAGMLPVIEDINWLSVTIALFATAVSARMLTEAPPLSWLEHIWAALRLPFSGFFRLVSDLGWASRSGTRRQRPAGVLVGLLGWASWIILSYVDERQRAQAPTADRGLSHRKPTSWQSGSRPGHAHRLCRTVVRSCSSNSPTPALTPSHC